MGQHTGIEWTEATWNPVTGCTKISPGCAHCYAERMANRLRAMGVRQYRNGFQVSPHADMLEVPLRWRKPRRIFVNSMSDLFHEQVPLGFIQDVFSVMEQACWHDFQVLTKRPEIALARAPHLPWPANVWLGTSVENALFLHRVRTLRMIPAKLRFLSLEPLLGPIPALPLAGIHWVIVGGESGPGARPMEKRWASQVRDRCVSHGVPFFFKQWGGVNRKRTGRRLDRRTWDQMPEKTAKMEECLLEA
jgi:protein gp37